jgi:hypothetical protein
MVARLARPPLGWFLREGGIVVLIAIPVVLIVLAQWLWVRNQPTQRLVPVEGTVVRVSVSYASKYGPVTWIDAELPDHSVATVRMSGLQMWACKAGTRIHLRGWQSNRGIQIDSVDSTGCR